MVLNVGEKYLSVQIDESCFAEIVRCVINKEPFRFSLFPNKEKENESHPDYRCKFGALWVKEKKAQAPSITHETI